jgi:sirohydrochlorin cobaltochelatase
MEKRIATIIALLISVTLVCAAFGMGEQPNKKAIVLAGFGTSYPSALVAIANIQKQVQKAFPGITVKIAFTSNIIRGIWHNRQNDKEFQVKNKDIPKEILYVKGPLATISDLQDEGYRTIIVQPTHIYNGEEYTDICSYVNGLNTIKTIKPKFAPFVKLVIGRPALGKYGVQYDYHKDMETGAKALHSDVALAKKEGAALVYMGHGNEFYSTGIYAEFQQTMRKTYPNTKIFIGTVEGFPSLEDVAFALKHTGVGKVLLKPMMVVAGDHANNDMAGPEQDSWKSVLEHAKIKVHPVLHGLGENTQWAQIYVQHIRDAARDNGIALE